MSERSRRAAAAADPRDAALRAALATVASADVPRLARRIAALAGGSGGDAERARIAAAIERSAEKVAARVAGRPRTDYPPELPVSQRAAEIAAAISANPVVIVSGETGSGKTTQLPKICLDAGRGVRGLIGHTQPRRIAARAVAERIAAELHTTVGEAVGFKVRFTDHTRPDAYVKLMTDGILLAETQGDRTLAQYDTIIVDEAHERSLNIDFLLGYLKGLVARRDDLRVVITSATLDAARFAAHFARRGVPAPVIEVSGRMYPVEIRHRAAGADADDEADDETPLEEAIVDAAEALWREGPGDILAFLPGEREIRETADIARRALARKPYAAAVEVLPLFARLSVAEQRRVFAPSSGRRLVLATNVAETSLTVPGVRYVIDTGLARIKRYSPRNRTTLLAIEKVSRASANQRAGRCGRVQDGICVRLYDEDDFRARPAFTDPEILRSSLASVILRAAALDLGPVEDFPFVDAPGARAIADGYALLQELGCVDADRALTPQGRELARLPLDPRIGRILFAARDAGCLAEALVIASALAVPDPLERPHERRAAADQAHLRFRDAQSDFLTLVALWEFFVDLERQGNAPKGSPETQPSSKGEARAARVGGARLTHRQRVDACRAQFVSFLRLTEWRDVHAQLVAQLEEAGWTWSEALPAKIDARRYADLHRALLTGLLSNIGFRGDDGDGYAGARGIRFALHPSSTLAKARPKWVLAAELTETTRLYARCAAKIEPEWIEAVAGERVAREHFDAHWDARRGEVVAHERVTLYGLTLVARRPVSFGPIDPAAAHAVFVREALAAGDLGVDAPFLAHNRKLVADVALLEHKARRQDVLVDEEAQAAFYAARVPAHIHSRAAFEHWRKVAEVRDPQLLRMTRETLMLHAAAAITEEQYPSTLVVAGSALPLRYRFAPGHPLDGLTLAVPLALLNQVDEAALSWLVPGMLREKLTLIMKALPKAVRNRLMPLPEHVTAFLASEPPRERHLHDALRDWLREAYGVAVDRATLDAIELPPHLRVNVDVADAQGRELASGRDLAALRRTLGEAARLSFAGADASFERADVTRWDFGALPASLAVVRDGARVTGYPALVDHGDRVSLTLLDTAPAAAKATRRGVVRLVTLALKDAWSRYAKGPPAFNASALALRAKIPADALLADALAAIADRAFVGDDPLPRDDAAFAAQVARARARLPAVAEHVFRLLGEIAAAWTALSRRLAALPPARARLAADIRAQRDALVHEGFLAATPWAHLTEIPRYLAALDRRLAKYDERPERDGKHGALVAEWRRRYDERREADRKAGRDDPRLEDFRWLVEELKVSLFAQELKTPFPVSQKRVEKAWAALHAG
jgi:ATP-dependent helicase HrpA